MIYFKWRKNEEILQQQKLLFQKPNNAATSRHLMFESIGVALPKRILSLN